MGPILKLLMCQNVTLNLIVSMLERDTLSNNVSERDNLSNNKSKPDTQSNNVSECDIQYTITFTKIHNYNHNDNHNEYITTFTII